jgi:hypothetical protein
MKVSKWIILAGLVGVFAAPVQARTWHYGANTHHHSTKMHRSAHKRNNPQRPYVDTSGINKGANPADNGATGSIAGSRNTGAGNTGGNNAGGNAGNTGGGTGGNQ